ncbi:hypothetical protein [Paraburkholderia sp. Ac-20347]|uniref:hypothetical protein n=1 Tax=Paraburkholderia sp. Ac-20347 TaxID=2703892 RepID=UPI0019823ACE|nr:hypothetical protein [Paraburkholderia sp. Ac-20347]MBN3812224.1 hypothetical protein [Paraburkholderia sp. Ac-20347]
MPIVNGPRPDRDFTIVRNAVINDTRLSLAARFILIYLLSKPESWAVSPQDLVNQSRDSARPSGKKVIYAALDELINVGYVHRRRLAKGGVEYTVYHLPQSTCTQVSPSENIEPGPAGVPLCPNGKVAFDPLCPKGKVPKGKVPKAPLVKTEVVEKTEVKEKPEPLRVVTKRSGEKKLPFKAFIESCKARGEQVIPDSDPIFTYADRSGIPHDVLLLAWQVFRDKYLADEAKQQIDWRATFRSSVQGSWFRLWFFDQSTGECRLTTAGEQAKRNYQRAA